MGRRLAIQVEKPKESYAATSFPEAESSNSDSSSQEGEKGMEEKKADIVTHTARNIFKLSSWLYIPIIFPPDDIIIDELKVSIVDRKFFLIEEVRTFLIKDIIDVVLDTNIIFATIKISYGEFKEEPHATEPDPTKPVKEPFMVKFLLIDQAAKARRIIAGLKIMAIQKEDTSKMGIEELRGKAEELGRAR